MQHRKAIFAVVVIAVPPCAAIACAQIASITAVPKPIDAGADIGMMTSIDGAVCEVGQIGCVSNSIETCGDNGQWEEDAASLCANQTCDDAMCTGECAPGESRCADGGVQTCTGAKWTTVAACATGSCSSASGIDSCIGSTTTGNSCSGGGAGLNNCGAGGSGNESCCTSIEVPGGTYFRSYDGQTLYGMSRSAPATVSGLRVDKYLVTVGRFRQWVEEFGLSSPPVPVLPTSGAGVHTHLNGGLGLADSTTTTGFELGWQTSWNSNIASTVDEWDQNLGMSVDGGEPNPNPCSDLETWTAKPGKHENLPISCVTWYEAYAFCIWDAQTTGGKGFLPSEAEWNYVAAGGGSASGQRVYAFSSPSNSTNINCKQADFLNGCVDASSGFPENVGTTLPAGAALWGHADLTGNLWEWVLDLELAAETYPMPCVDCTVTNPNGPVFQDERQRRGGAYYEPASVVPVANRGSPQNPISRTNGIGFRCARTP